MIERYYVLIKKIPYYFFAHPFFWDSCSLFKLNKTLLHRQNTCNTVLYIQQKRVMSPPASEPSPFKPKSTINCENIAQVENKSHGLYNLGSAFKGHDASAKTVYRAIHYKILGHDPWFWWFWWLWFCFGISKMAGKLFSSKYNFTHILFE